MSKQTAIEWLKKELETYGNPGLCKIEWKTLDELIEQAKEMEKKQIINAYIADFTFVGRISDAEQYYKETYEQE